MIEVKDSQLTKLFQCPNCKSKSLEEEKVIMIQCGCGYPMDEEGEECNNQK